MSPRPPPQISLKQDWKRELGSEDAERAEGQVVQPSRSFQSNQPISNPDHDRTVQPVVRTDWTGQPVIGTNTRTVQDGRKTPRSQEIDTRSFPEEAVKDMIERGNPLLKHTDNVPDGSLIRSFHEGRIFNVGDETVRERTGQPVVNSNESSHEQMLNEVNMDFRIPRLPHSVVKQAQNSRVRELVKMIENHPDRHALQQELQQTKAYNPFSAESKQMIQDVGNVELFDLFETDPKTQCKECLSYWSEGIAYCTCGHLLKESGQSKFLCVYAGTSLNSRIRHQEGKTSWPQIWEISRKENIFRPKIWKKCIKKKFTGIHVRFLRDHVFRERMIQNNRDEDVCRARDVLADEDHTYHLSESEYF